MKIATCTRITVHQQKEKEKFKELLDDPNWVIYDGVNDFVTFEKISEVILV